MAGPESPPVTLEMRGGAGFDIDGHADEGVDERERVGARVFRRPREDRYIRDIWRQFDEERIARRLLRRRHHLLGQVRGSLP